MVTNSQRGMSRKVTSLAAELRESRADTLHAADRARRAEVENERLRELLSIAREELRIAAGVLDHFSTSAARGARAALRSSDPDASAPTEED